MAEMLMTRGINVTFLIRETRFWGNVLPEEEGKLVERHMRAHHVDLRFDTELSEIVGDDSGRAVGVKTNKGEQISCEFIGLTAGVSPNVDFLKHTELEIERGIVVNQYLETNIPNVYAIGDCAQNSNPVKGRRPIEQVWYTGRMMGETLARTICGEQTAYKPGIWFNSAKFFDIEYQTYGEVLSELKVGQERFYWEDTKGQICYKMVFDTETKKVVGINVFGMRMRHEIWDAWLRSGKDANFVMAHLRDANFDPEFYKKYEKDIVSEYNQQTGGSVELKRKNWGRLLSKNY